MHRSQVLFYLLIAFLVGVFLASVWQFTQSSILIILACGISVVAIFGYQKTFSQKGLLAGAMILVAVFGIIRFNSFNAASSILKQFSDKEAGGQGIPTTIRGFVKGAQDKNGTR